MGMPAPYKVRQACLVSKWRGAALPCLEIPLCSAFEGARASRPTTAPSSSRGLQQEPGQAVPVAGAAFGGSPPPASGYSKRRVQNTAAALKTAILDEIVGECAARVCMF